MLIVDCYIPGTAKGAQHRCSAELTDAEILRRFGLETSRYHVAVWPECQPDETRLIHAPAATHA